jgi:ribose-phosphate pyrophosphokinase
MSAKLAVHAFAEDAAPAQRLAAAMGAPTDGISRHDFPDGEVMPVVPARSPRTVVVYGSLHRPNSRLLPLMLAADAYRRLGVRRLVLVAPYFCYLRQDTVFEPGQPLSRDVIGPWVGSAFDRVVTVQPHLHRTADLGAVLGTSCEVLDVMGELASVAAGTGPPPLVIGPDEESTSWARSAAERIGGDWTTFRKTRLGDFDVRLMLPADVEIQGRSVLLVDDICSSGGTLGAAAAQLKARRAEAVDVAVVHALFDTDAERRLRAAGVRRITSSDSILHPTNGLELAGVLARALKHEIR